LPILTISLPIDQAARPPYSIANITRGKDKTT